MSVLKGRSVKRRKMNRDEQIRQRIIEMKAAWAEMRSRADAARKELDELNTSMIATAGAIGELQRLLPTDAPPTD